MKNIVIFIAIATILAVSGLGYTFITNETNRKSNENLNVQIQAVNSDLISLQNRLTALNSSLTQLSKSLGDLDTDLQREIVNIQGNVSSLLIQISNIKSDISTIQSSISDLQSKVASLETRVSTLEAERPITIRINFLSFVPDAVPPGGADYLFDAEVEGPGVYAQARTGHSRFIKPRYLDLVVRNGTRFIGTQVTIKLYAYWHLDDVVIDIDPNPAHGRTIGTNPSGGYLTLSYTIGTVLQGTVNGNDDGYVLDLYDAYLAYKIETLT